MKQFFLFIFFAHIFFDLSAFDVRVLLASYQLSSLPVIELRSAGGFFVESLDRQNIEAVMEPLISITFARGRLLLNGRPLAVTQIRIYPNAPVDGIFFGEQVYDGAFMLSLSKGSLFIVNRLDLEEYLSSVLRWEGWPTWHSEANKAFAVVCRTYAVHKIFETRQKKKSEESVRLFDIKASNAHQTYRGRHKQKHWQSVVDQTRGMVLVHDGKPIAAMYDMSCGGVVPSDLSGVDFARYPYFKRTYACNFCQKWSYGQWQKELTVSEFESRTGFRIYAGGKKDQTFVGSWDKAGVLQELSVKTRRGMQKLSGKKFYSLFKKEAKSLRCTVKKEKNKIVLQGTGYGHLLGYCQWGAAFMAKELGMKAQELLQFFFPGTQLARLKKMDG